MSFIRPVISDCQLVSGPAHSRWTYPEDGKTAVRPMYPKKPMMFGKMGRQNWTREKVEGIRRVQPIPTRIPTGGECFEAVDEGWPEMAPTAGWLFYRCPRAVRELVAAGDMDCALSLVAELDLLNKERYASVQLRGDLSA
jgi:hypothetical protein